VCVPNCTGKECGGDNCGETCAPGCSDTEFCDDNGQCQPNGSEETGPMDTGPSDSSTTDPTTDPTTDGSTTDPSTSSGGSDSTSTTM